MAVAFQSRNGPIYRRLDQTIRLMNSEYYYPHTADRATRASWLEAGGLDMRERARQQARATLRSTFPEIWDDALDQRLRDTFDIRLPQAVMQPGGYP